MKVGDKVKIKLPEDTSRTCWVVGMEQFVGEILTVKRIITGLAFDVEETNYSFPLDCVECVVETKKRKRIEEGDRVLIIKPDDAEDMDSIYNCTWEDDEMDNFNYTVQLVERYDSSDDTFEITESSNWFDHRWATKVETEDLDFLKVLSTLPKEMKINMMEFIKNNVDNQAQTAND